MSKIQQEARARCKAVTAKGKQCTREGIYYRGGKLYCPNHHAKLLAEAITRPAKTTGPA